MKNTKKPKMSRIVMAALPILIIIAIGIPGLAQPFSDWSAPVNLGAAVNSGRGDAAPFLSYDGLSLFFMSNVGTNASIDIYVSRRDTRNSQWGTPVSLGPDINTPFIESFPFLSKDGRYLLFTSDRPGGCGAQDIYIAYRRGRDDSNNFTEWKEPVNLGCTVNSVGLELSPSVFEAEDGTVQLYFSSGLRPGGLGFGDLYSSWLQADGTFGAVKQIEAFNTIFNDIHPTVREPDGLEIIFSSNRPGSIANTPDLYTSSRACLLCQWDPAVNVGATVNSNALDLGAKLSSDGTELYFYSNRAGGFGNEDIYVSRRALRNSVAFQSTRDGNSEIYVMSSDGMDQIRLTDNAANDQRPDVSPNGNHVVFASSRITQLNPEGDFEIFVMNLDGSDVRQITVNNAVESWPRWSPEGQWIAFHSNVNGNFEIYVVRPNGTQLSRVTNYAGLDQFPEWSPTGEQLAIRRDSDIYLIRVDGSIPTKLTEFAGINQMASFSPDGMQLAFMSTRAGYPSVFVMDVNGGNQTNLTLKPDNVPASQWSSRAPGWSRNGADIYFTALRPETGANENVWAMNPDGTGVTRLTIAMGSSAEAAVR